MKVHCLFEQSGTFKNEFKALGIDAFDYDILDDFGETDHVVDLFEHIRGVRRRTEPLRWNIKRRSDYGVLSVYKIRGSNRYGVSRMPKSDAKMDG